MRIALSEAWFGVGLGGEIMACWVVVEWLMALISRVRVTRIPDACCTRETSN